MENKTISFCMFSSPIGDLKLFATDDALIYVQFPEALPFRVELYLKHAFTGIFTLSRATVPS